jgi:hypothetical protein
VQYYYAHNGKDSDGLQLSKPRLAYLGAARVGVNWRDPAFPDHDLTQPSPDPTEAPMSWPQVYRDETPAADLPQLVAAHDNVLTISVWQTYFTVPWPRR